MADLSRYYPLAGRETIGSETYEWDFVSKSLGTLHYGVNGETLRMVQLKQTADEFRDFVQRHALARADSSLDIDDETVTAMQTALGRKIPDAQLSIYAQAWAYLHASGNVFLTFCARFLFDYHALDRELMQTTLLSMTRAMYSSPSSALLHLDFTGPSGAGKNDLASRVTALIPSNYLELFSTVSPTALQYRTIERVRDYKGHVVDVRPNKDTFRGKIICITEVSDAAGFSALKALAETDENAEYTHTATVNGTAIDMTIRGPRCVIITSVDGVNDEQVKRRFIHGSVCDNGDENRNKKMRLIESLLKDRKDIRDDPRLAIARAGLDFIFSTKAVIFEPVDDEAWALIEELDDLFLDAEYGITSITQFFSLCECIALWKRFAREYTRIEVEDVQEAWFLLAHFERETITKTSQAGIDVLKAIKELCDDYDEAFELNPAGITDPKRPTRREVVKSSEISQARVYRLLQSKPNDQGKCGELIELGYVRDVVSNERFSVELTKLGQTVLTDVPGHAIVNMEEYEPKEPILPDDVELDQHDYHDYQRLSEG